MDAPPDPTVVLPPGLRNIGQSCWYNALLQSLASCSSFCAYVELCERHARQRRVCQQQWTSLRWQPPTADLHTCSDLRPHQNTVGTPASALVSSTLSLISALWQAGSKPSHLNPSGHHGSGNPLQLPVMNALAPLILLLSVQVDDQHGNLEQQLIKDQHSPSSDSQHSHHHAGHSHSTTPTRLDPNKALARLTYALQAHNEGSEAGWGSGGGGGMLELGEQQDAVEGLEALCNALQHEAQALARHCPSDPGLLGLVREVSNFQAGSTWDMVTGASVSSHHSSDLFSNNRQASPAMQLMATRMPSQPQSAATAAEDNTGPAAERSLGSVGTAVPSSASLPSAIEAHKQQGRLELLSTSPPLGSPRHACLPSNSKQSQQQGAAQEQQQSVCQPLLAPPAEHRLQLHVPPLQAWLAHTRTCCTCGSTSLMDVTPSWVIPLTVPHVINRMTGLACVRPGATLQACLAAYTRPHFLEDVTCIKCSLAAALPPSMRLPRPAAVSPSMAAAAVAYSAGLLAQGVSAVAAASRLPPATAKGLPPLTLHPSRRKVHKSSPCTEGTQAPHQAAPTAQELERDVLTHKLEPGGSSSTHPSGSGDQHHSQDSGTVHREENMQHTGQGLPPGERHLPATGASESGSGSSSRMHLSGNGNQHCSEASGTVHREEQLLHQGHQLAGCVSPASNDTSRPNETTSNVDDTASCYTDATASSHANGTLSSTPSSGAIPPSGLPLLQHLAHLPSWVPLPDLEEWEAEELVKTGRAQGQWRVRRRMLGQSGICRLPRVLVLQLRRSTWDTTIGQPIKVHGRLPFPVRLLPNDISPLLHHGFSGRPGQPSPAHNLASSINGVLHKDPDAAEHHPHHSDAAQEHPDQQGSNTSGAYRLVAVLVHMGGARSGHYIAYRRLYGTCSPASSSSSSPMSSSRTNGCSPSGSVDSSATSSRSDDAGGYAEDGKNVGSQNAPQLVAPTVSGQPQAAQPGRWCMASDTHVHEVDESQVLGCEATVLFYEREQ